MIDVINEVKIYEIDGKDTKFPSETKLKVESHWNYRNFVVLKFKDMCITVPADDLLAAIKNATNKGSY